MPERNPNSNAAHTLTANLGRRALIASALGLPLQTLPLHAHAQHSQARDTPSAASPLAARQAALLDANPAEFKRVWTEFTGGTSPQASGLKLELSALADNPSAVPVKVSVDGISAQHWCEEIILLAELNPSPLACRLLFSPLAGVAEAAVRIRLSQSQTVHALARMNDGKLLAAKQAITVAASGCGM